MCTDAIYYNGTGLWSYWDNKVTSNTFNLEFFTYQTSNQQKLQQPKFKFVIYSQSSNSSSITLHSSELYKYIYTLKKKIVDSLNTHIQEISKSNKYTNGFTHNTNGKNNLYTTIMYNELLDAPCIRFMIGEKEKSILDTDKVYVPLIEFLSLNITLNKAFDNYCLMSQNITILDQLRKLEDKVNSNFSSLSDSICKYGNDSKCVKEYIEKSECITLQSSDDKKHELTTDLNISLDELDDEIKTEPVEDKKDSEDNIEFKDSEFDSFLKAKRDTYELDLPKSKSVDESKTQKDIVLENIFQKKILNNNLKNIDIIVKNCVNSGTPIDSFVNTVFTMSGVDLYKGISDIDKYCLNYVISQNIKYNVCNYLSNKVQPPKVINPIIVEDLDKSQIQGKIDCMYFLLILYIYFSKVNMEYLDNSINVYCLKTMTSPFVFTHILDISKDVLVESVVKLYNSLKYEDKFFDEYEKNIKLNSGINIDVSVPYVKEQIEKIYDNTHKYKNSLHVSKFFNRKIMKLTYEDICKIDQPYDVNVAKNIIKVEYYSDKNIDKNIKDTSNIPLHILNVFGINEHKFDNDILVKYIKSKYPEFIDLEQIKNINVSVKDIINNIDITKYPIDILKALYFWNIELLPKNITYNDFVKLIEDSNLESQELISMICNSDYKSDDTFFMVLNNYE